MRYALVILQLACMRGQAQQVAPGGESVERCPDGDPMNGDGSNCSSECLTCAGPPCAPLPMTRWPRCKSCKSEGLQFWVEHMQNGPSCIESCDTSLGYYEINSTNCGRCGGLSETDCAGMGCRWFSGAFGGSRAPVCEASASNVSSSSGMQLTWLTISASLAAMWFSG
mmetsp:Transcript_169880/g.545164  ORF Transcript_169880/g.545164 Transcript_169880/m.545164 type:complete len:168 (-) Transcript_169880:74-577(-)